MADTEQILGNPTGRLCPGSHKTGNVGKCGKPLIWRESRYGTYHACPDFPACRGKIGAPRGSGAKAGPSEEPRKYVRTEEPTSEGEPTGPSGAPPDAPPAVTAAQEAKAQEGIGGALWIALQPIVQAEIDRRAATVAAEIVAKAGGSTVVHEWVDPAGIVIAEIKGAHAAMGEIMIRVKAGLNNILIVGPAGSGKTKLAHDLASALGREFSTVSCTAGMPEWHLTGRSMPNLQTGESVYQIAPFVRLYRDGGVFLLDEVDAADPNVLLVMNSALANGHMVVPGLGVVTRHPDFILIAAANTYGNGADRMYVGRNQLDASTLSRFACAVIDTDYDRDLEAKLVPNAGLLSKVWAIREKVQALKIRKVVGTRELLAAHRLVSSGLSMDAALKAMCVPFTPDERSKVGVAS